MKNIAKAKIVAYLKTQTNVSDKVTSPILEVHCGVRDQAFRDLIHELRKSGDPIASDNRGYWWAQTASEMQSTIRQMQSRVNSLLDVIPALQATMNRLPE